MGKRMKVPYLEELDGESTGLLLLVPPGIGVAQAMIWLQSGFWPEWTLTTILGSAPALQWKGIEQIAARLWEQPLWLVSFAPVLIAMGAVNGIVSMINRSRRASFERKKTAWEALHGPLNPRRF